MVNKKLIPKFFEEKIKLMIFLILCHLKTFQSQQDFAKLNRRKHVIKAMNKMRRNHKINIENILNVMVMVIVIANRSLTGFLFFHYSLR